jgi:hypothetical protein
MTDAVASNPNSAKSTTPPTAATAPTTSVCSPAPPPAIQHNYWPFPPSALALKHPTSRRSSALSFFLAFPQPSDVRPTTTATESPDFCRTRHSSTCHRRASGPASRPHRHKPRRTLHPTRCASHRQAVSCRVHARRCSVRPRGPAAHVDPCRAARPAAVYRYSCVCASAGSGGRAPVNQRKHETVVSCAKNATGASRQPVRRLATHDTARGNRGGRISHAPAAA